MTTEKRYIRQAEIVKERDIVCTVVGVGAVGRQVSLQLCAMGIKTINIIDMDRVDIENLAVQGFRDRDLNKEKVVAVRSAGHEINRDVQFNSFYTPYNKGIVDWSDVVFCCVDDIGVRGDVVKGEHTKARYIIDCRMLAESFRILTIDTEKAEDLEHYEKTLFSADEAHVARCTSKATIYCSNISAGFMVGELTKFLRGIRFNRDYQVSIYGNMITKTMETEAEEEESAGGN